jgi:glycogen operon protein
MLLAGDELGQTQNGNNNAYCQDNETSWLDWDLTHDEREFLEFAANMVAFRRHHPVFSRRRFLQDRTLADGVKEVAWLGPDGVELTSEDWNTSFNRCLGVYMAGTAIERVDKRGRPVKDNNFLMLFNAHHEEIPFLLPEFHAGGAWLIVLDTANDVHPFEQRHYDAGARLPLQGRSMVALIATTPHPALRTQRAAAPPAQPPSLKGPRPVSAPAAPPTEPLPEKLGQDSKGG